MLQNKKHNIKSEDERVFAKQSTISLLIKSIRHIKLISKFATKNNQKKKEEKNLVAQYFERFRDPWQGTQEHHLPPYTKQGIIRVAHLRKKISGITGEIQHKT